MGDSSHKNILWTDKEYKLIACGLSGLAIWEAPSMHLAMVVLGYYCENTDPRASIAGKYRYLNKTSPN